MYRSVQGITSQMPGQSSRMICPWLSPHTNPSLLAHLPFLTNNELHHSYICCAKWKYSTLNTWAHEVSTTMIDLPKISTPQLSGLPTVSSSRIFCELMIYEIWRDFKKKSSLWGRAGYARNHGFDWPFQTPGMMQMMIRKTYHERPPTENSLPNKNISADKLGLHCFKSHIICSFVEG